MKLIILIGPQAVGKMTIGQELEKLSGWKLFHNHITIDIVAPFFSYGTPQGRRLVRKLRQAFYDAFVESDYPGFILTFVIDFDDSADVDGLERLSDWFEEKGYVTYWIELEACPEERLKRNRTENRLTHKPTKRDLEWSDADLINSHRQDRCNSYEGEIAHPNYLRIDNTEKTAKDVAQQIWNHIRT